MAEEHVQPSTRPNFPAMEEEISVFWEKHKIFERSIDERPEAKTFSFYDGPPFATGLPHYGHLLQSAIKDAVPRYKTMQGFRVPRRWGWDCHGLPVENLIEKELKLNSKKDIEAYGIEKFNLACFRSVTTYVGEWKKYIRRIGRWVDMEKPYKTMDASFVESVWWGFAELWKKKLIYKDLRVSLYCPRCSTPLSNAETAMGDSYIDAEDPSVTIKFRATEEPDTYFLAWTTTPWTLPANVALAVHPDEIYVRARIRDTGETLIFADKLLSNVLRHYFPLGDSDVPFEILSKTKGSELVGMTYEPLYPLSGDTRAALTARPGTNAYQVVAMDYVTIEDGTGIVHTAPAFGEDDFLASKENDLPVIVTVDEEGRQKSGVPIAAGMRIKESDPVITADLERRGLLYRSERASHSVAICWRCSTPLLYKAQPAWFVHVTKIKSKMLDAAKRISWHPEHFKTGRFGKGLESAPDWCISRTRFWGAPMPVWTCDACGEHQVFGSIHDVEKASGASLDAGKDGLNLHRPYIDAVTVACSCGGRASRIPEVLDTWFDSGSMPFASAHYPFENKKSYEKHFPADFIAEAQDQTRGWFYTLHVLSTALFGKAAFRDVVVTGLVMAEDGKKMSKSLKNYPDPWELMTTVGADALRLYFFSSPIMQAESLNFSQRDCETIQRTLFGTLWNIRAFYLLAAGTDRIEITKPRSTHVLDRWLIARLHQLTQEMTEAMEATDLVAAVRPLRLWIDDFSTWWLRRSRDRLKSENAFEKLDALRTMREALLQTSLLLAPFAPFMSEKIYQDLSGPKMSVHLDRWPKIDPRLIDPQLVGDMAWIRTIAASGHDERVRAKQPVRQALASVTIRMRDAAAASRVTQRTELLNVLRDELNVERVNVVSGTDTGEDEFRLELDTELTPELKKKGLLRELTRRVMNVRKDLGLQPQDRILLQITVADQGHREWFETMAPSLMKELKADDVRVSDTTSAADKQETLTIDGLDITIGVRRS